MGGHERRPKAGWDQVAQQHPELLAWLEEDIGEHRARTLAEMVAAYRNAYHRGPAWSQVASQARPQLAQGYSSRARQGYADRLVRALATKGWLIYDPNETGSLRSGPRLGTSRHPSR